MGIVFSLLHSISLGIMNSWNFTVGWIPHWERKSSLRTLVWRAEHQQMQEWKRSFSYFRPSTSWKPVGSYFGGKWFLWADGNDLMRWIDSFFQPKGWYKNCLLSWRNPKSVHVKYSNSCSVFDSNTDKLFKIKWGTILY